MDFLLLRDALKIIFLSLLAADLVLYVGNVIQQPCTLTFEMPLYICIVVAIIWFTRVTKLPHDE